MKKLLLLICAILIIGNANAQEKKTEKDYKWSVGVQISNPINDVNAGWFDIDGESFDGNDVRDNSFSLGAFVSFCSKTKNYYRLRLGYTNIDVTEYTNGIFGNTQNTGFINGKQNKIHIAPGIFRNINNDKLHFFGGFEIPINLYREYTLHGEGSLTDISSGIIVEQGNSDQILNPGYSIGIGGIFGFDWQIIKQFSIGAEFSPSLLYGSFGGKVTLVQNGILPISYTSTAITEQDKLKTLTFYENRFSINISYKFKH